MTLAPASRIGTYEIVAPLGAGGMGEVYRGRDTRLGRDVALEVLPSSLSNDPDRLARFERESRVKALIIERQRRNGDLVLIDFAK